MKKRLLSLFLTIALLFTTAQATYAGVGSEQDEHIDIPASSPTPVVESLQVPPVQSDDTEPAEEDISEEPSADDTVVLFSVTSGDYSYTLSGSNATICCSQS